MTALDLITLTPEQSAELEGYAAESATILVKLQTLPDNPALLDKCLTFVQSKLRAIEETRKSITGPLHKAKTNADAHFASLSQPYEDSKDYLKGRLVALESARMAANLNPETAGLVPRMEGPSLSYEWQWELEDISKVPVEFLALNPASMKLYARQYANSQVIDQIPGVRFTRVPKVRAKAG